MGGKTTNKRVMVLAVFALTGALLLSGCWDRREINDDAFVLASGIDLEENGMLRVTILVPLPGQMGGSSGGGGGTSGQKTYYVDSDTGRTLSEAIRKMQKRMARQMNFSHRRVLIIGETLARKGIAPLFDEIVRSPEGRLTTYLIIARGNAADLLNADPKLERNSAEAIRELCVKTGFNIKTVAQALNQLGNDPLIAIMGTKKTEKGKEPSTEVEVKGYSQFRYDKMVDVLENEALFGMLWLKNKIQPYQMEMELSEGKRVSVLVQSGSTKITPSVRRDGIHFDIEAEGDITMMEDLKMTHYSQEEAIRHIRLQANRYIKRAIESALNKIASNRADSASFGLKLYRKYPREWDETFKRNWYDHLARASFSVQVETKMAKMGLITESIGKRETH